MKGYFHPYMELNVNVREASMQSLSYADEQRKDLYSDFWDCVLWMSNFMRYLPKLKW